MPCPQQGSDDNEHGAQLQFPWAFEQCQITDQAKIKLYNLAYVISLLGDPANGWFILKPTNDL